MEKHVTKKHLVRQLEKRKEPIPEKEKSMRKRHSYPASMKKMGMNCQEKQRSEVIQRRQLQGSTTQVGLAENSSWTTREPS